MITGKTQGQVQPYAYGTMTQTSTYGATIPNIIGCTQSPLLAIWAANVREGGSSKKFKQLKKGVTTYCENISFMVGYNPIMGILQIWNNGSLNSLDFAVQTFTGGTSWTITDPHFYAIIAVTIDLGNYGEMPLWNAAMNGPDPTHSSYYRLYPFVYRWLPSYGATAHTDNTEVITNASVKVYYAKLNKSTKFQTPLANNRLHFEKILGDGDEYAGDFLHTITPLSSQQILYPMYAGVGSASIDLGVSGTIPQLQAEVQGKWGLYSRGDADFVDMIEDIIKSSLAQAALDSPTYAGHTQLGHGLGALDYPGCIQMKCLSSNGGMAFPGTMQYDVNVTKNNFLVVIAETTDGSGSSVGISDSLANTWTPVFSGSPTYQVFYCQNTTSDIEEVTLTGLGTGWSVVLLEVGGVDTFDSVVIGSGGVASLATSNEAGFPNYLLSVGLYPGTQPYQPTIPLWNLMTDVNELGSLPVLDVSIQERSGNYPVTASATIDTTGLTAQCILAFKCVQPATYPQPVGSFLDAKTLAWTRRQDRANGLYGSISMSSQQSCKDYLDKLYTAANAAPVYVGDKLYSMPLSDVRAWGNGIVYNPPYGGTPGINLSTEKGDFVKNLPKLQTKSHTNEDNVLQMQCLSRAANYAPSVVMQPEQGSIALYGLRKGAAVQNNAIQDVAIARKILGVEVKKLQYGGEDTYTFTLPAKYCLLAPMGAGGSGNGYSSGDKDIPLPRPPAADETVLFARGTTFTGSRLGPFGPSIWTGGKVLYGYTSENALMMTTGGTLVPNTLTGEYSIFIAPGLLDTAVVTAAYPISFMFSDGGFSDLEVSSPSGAYMNGNMLSSPTITGAAMKTMALHTIFTMTHADSVPGADPNFCASMYAAIAIYVKNGPVGLSNFVPLPMSPNIIDSVITITDPLADFIEVPVQITSIKENEDLTLSCEAMPYIPGMLAPTDFVADTPQPFSPNPGTVPVSVNPPVFIEPTPRLSQSISTLQLWIIVSDSSADYGGCIPMVSTDGGASYVPLGGSIIGNSVTGYSTADWPASSDPDTTNDLPLDLTESNGILQSYSAAARDNFQYQCYIAGGGSYLIPYELFSYNAATLTSASHYTIQATGAGNDIRRGVYAAPSPGIGVDHPNNSRFAFIDPSGAGMIKTTMDATWIGKTLYFKFLAFNNFGTAQQALSDATAYPYTPTGIPGSIGPATGYLVNGV